jgi:hypothetical protein
MIESALCESFWREAVDGLHALGDEYRVALIRQGETGRFGPATDNYKRLGADEAKGTGYTKGGMPIERLPSIWDGSGCALQFKTPIELPSATLTAAGLLVYNSSKGGRAVLVQKFLEPLMVAQAPLIIDQLPVTILKG